MMMINSLWIFKRLCKCSDFGLKKHLEIKNEL